MEGAVALVNGTDVGVIQRGRCLGLAQESRLGFFVVEEVLGEEFEGDGEFEGGVLSFVDDAHAAFAEFGDDAVTVDCGTDDDDGGLVASRGGVRLMFCV